MTQERIKVGGWTNTKDARPDKNAVWLQDFGWVRGMQAVDVRPGMIMVYNGGTWSDVVHVELKGKSTALITTCDSKGREWTSSRRGLVPAQAKVLKQVKVTA